MGSIRLVIPGEPVAKARPRVMRSGVTYTPAKSKNYETLVKELYIQDHRDKPFLEGELKAIIIAYFTIPKSASKRKKQAMLAGEIQPTKKPDTDNISKIILDSLNGLAYRDDSQVVDLRVVKAYAERPRVEIDISEIN